MYPKDTRKRVVFLGTPQVAASVLEYLLQRASLRLKIVLVVSQPPFQRGQKLSYSPVHESALKQGIPVLTPSKVGEEEFLEAIRALEPDLCLTAAYGNYLTKSFLAIPRFGTVNIHPSLLPLYRGASPVQRSLENGDKLTGVSLLYTVEKMDAGPIIYQKTYAVDDTIKAPELLEKLFWMGAEIFVKNLDSIFNPSFVPVEQKHGEASHAKKIEVQESFLDFRLSAQSLHNKVRAFAAWPGTKVFFEVSGKVLEFKLISTKVCPNLEGLKPFDVRLEKDSIKICCGDGEILRIDELQQAGKKVLTAREFQNGLKGGVILKNCLSLGQKFIST